MNKVVRYDGKTYCITKVEDLEDILGYDLYTIVSDIMLEDKMKLDKQLKEQENDTEYYEMTTDSRNSCLLEIKDIIENLKPYILNAKRISRDKLIEPLDSMLNTIENEI